MMNMQSSGTQRSSGSVHKALKLPSPYRVRVAVEGSLGKVHYSLRVMGSETGGTVTVFAMSVSWAPWVEITQAAFEDLAKRIVYGKD